MTNRDLLLKNQNKTKTQRKGAAYLDYSSKSIKNDRDIKNSFALLKQAMSEVAAVNRKYGEPRQDGTYLPLQEKDIRTIMESYEKARRQCAALLKLSVSKRVDADSSFYRSLERVGKYISDDIAVLMYLQPGVTMPDMIERAHHQVITITKDNKDSHMKGQLSDRIPMALSFERDGKKVVRKGVFTKKTVHDPEKMFEKHYKDALKRCRKFKNTDAEEAIKEFAEMQKRDTKDMYSFVKKMKWNSDTKDFSFPEPSDTNKSRWLNGKYNDLDDKGVQLLHYYFAQIFDTASLHDLYLTAGIKAGSRLDNRNSAMSAVAELLGMPDIIAKSVPVTLKTAEGTVEGTFMEFAEGYDANHVTKDSPLLKLRDANFMENEGLLQDLINIQILDYICGNTDRHGGNIFYQCDQDNNVNKGQGIDNDMAFGVIDEKYLDYHRKELPNFVPLKDINVVMKKTADAVTNLTPELLTTVLQRYGLTDAEIAACCDRMQRLQKDIKDERIRTVPESEMKQAIDFGTCAARNIAYDHDRNMMSGGAGGAIKMLRYLSLDHPRPDGKEKRAIEEPKPLGEAVAEITQVEFSEDNFIEKLEGLKNDLEAATHNVHNGSQEYKNVLSYTEVALQEFRRMKNDGSDPERELVLMENLGRLSEIYLNRKRNDGSLKNDEKSRKRAMAVQSLYDKVTNYADRLGVTNHDHYCIMANLSKKGVFDTKRGSKELGRSIEQMKVSITAGRPLDLADVGLNTIFDAVSAKAWEKTYLEYADELKRYSQMTKDLRTQKTLKETEDSIRQKAQEIKEGKPHSNALRDLQITLNKLADGTDQVFKGYAQSALSKDDRNFLVILQGVCRLNKKASEGIMTPVDYKEQIAEKMLPAYAVGKKAEVLCNPDRYNRAMINIRKKPGFAPLTEAKTPEKLSKLAQMKASDLVEAMHAAERTLPAELQKEHAAPVRANQLQ